MRMSKTSQLSLELAWASDSHHTINAQCKPHQYVHCLPCNLYGWLFASAHLPLPLAACKRLQIIHAGLALAAAAHAPEGAHVHWCKRRLLGPVQALSGREAACDRSTLAVYESGALCTVWWR